MVKVVAVEKGYFGGEIRDVGASFDVPSEIWSDKKRRPKWVKPDPNIAFGGKGDHDGDGHVGGSTPKAEGEKAAVVIPADWRALAAAKRRELASSIIGQKVPNAAEADRVIDTYLESVKPEVFGDAPQLETVKGNGIVEGLGGVQPDWVQPGEDDDKGDI